MEEWRSWGTHLAVRATRYGGSDKNTGTWSKRVFEMPHQKYPDTEWAKKTPYWFK
jgi:hypothetical protein